MSFMSIPLHPAAQAQPRQAAPAAGAGRPGSSGSSGSVEAKRLCRRCGLADCPANFAASGGVANGDAVADLLRARVEQPVSLLARWIVSRQVVSFSCDSMVLMPLFQFDFAQGRMHGGVAPVLSELAGVMTGDQLARWFVQPKTCLKGLAPAELLLSDSAAVLAVAREDRFLATA